MSASELGCQGTEVDGGRRGVLDVGAGIKRRMQKVMELSSGLQGMQESLLTYPSWEHNLTWLFLLP
jgi:hypothetical protein